MILIIAIVALTGLKYFEVGPFATMTWWWPIGLFIVAFIWFEFGERIFGLDKKKAHDKLDKAREERVKKMFGKK